jgi:hypothetical protein
MVVHEQGKSLERLLGTSLVSHHLKAQNAACLLLYAHL